MKTSDIVDVVAACFYGLMVLGLWGRGAFYVGPSEGWTLFSVVSYAILLLMLAGVLLSNYVVIHLVLKDRKGKK